MPDQSDRVAGALLGLACGDGLGGPFEGAPYVDPGRLRAWAEAERPLTYSDDTAMAAVLARHLVTHEGRIDDDALMAEFAEEWRSAPHRGYGAGPPRLFRILLDGGDWRAATRDLFGGTGSYGNGGAMRVAPVAFAPGGVTDVVELARRQASLTHAHPLALDGAAALGAAIHVVAGRDDPPGPTELCRDVAAHVRNETFRGRLLLAGQLAEQDSSPQDLARHLGHDVTSLGSVPTAIATFLRTPTDVEGAILAAVEAGGDTDTIGAMTGALAGAHAGVGALPESWLARLESASGLRDLADRLTRLRGPGEHQE